MAFPKEMTEGARVPKNQIMLTEEPLFNADGSLSRLRRQLPPGGSLGVHATLRVWASPDAFVIQMRNRL